MNGLVLRDYVREGLAQSPVAFARDYYLHYPKIAPFMWPPLFHVALGLFLLPGWPAGPASLVFVALVGAWLAWRLHYIVKLLAGSLAAWLAVVLLVTTPIVQAMSDVVMLDIAVAAFAFEAAVWLRTVFTYDVHQARGALRRDDGAPCVAKATVCPQSSRRSRCSR
jgi:4-amino-4-deoxy-L-arabinose transferase-like glycosyltransferase